MLANIKLTYSIYIFMLSCNIIFYFKLKISQPHISGFVYLCKCFLCVGVGVSVSILRLKFIKKVFIYVLCHLLFTSNWCFVAKYLRWLHVKYSFSFDTCSLFFLKILFLYFHCLIIKYANMYERNEICWDWQQNEYKQPPLLL